MGYPTIHFTEQVMREGMQIESVDISPADKLRLLNALSATGIKSIAVGSFVSPRYTPQMARIDEMLESFQPHPDVDYLALTLNEKGRERAASYPWITRPRRTPSLICHMCDTFVRRNANRTRQQEIDAWPSIVEQAVKDGAQEVGIGVGATWGSNFSGFAPLDERLELMRRQHALWDEAGLPVTHLWMADPMGWVMPHWLEEHIRASREEWPELRHYHIHLHDTRGLALASTYEALRVLDADDEVYLDTTAGGIGGCPYCGNGRAAGMVATEDLVNMLEMMGIATGVDLDALIRAVWMLEEMIGRPANGHVSKAGPHPSPDRLYDANLPLVETFEDARHFLLGPEVVRRQLRPWREPIPEPTLRDAGAPHGTVIRNA
jgi:hydroxymethylglutaryl-CoA lyase